MRRSCCTALGLAAMLGAADARAAPFTQLVVFGDSLADSGNIEILFATAGLPDPSPEAVGYYPGRFSNGPVYPDYLHQALFGTLATPALAGGSNFAYGGGRAVSGGDLAPDLAAQIAQFAVATGGSADPDALYLINAGGNDALAIALGAPDAPAPAEVGEAVADAVGLLSALGARNFLVANVLDIGLTPLLDGFEAEGLAVSLAINAALETSLDGLMLPADATLVRFDAFGVTQGLLADAANAGFTELETPCFLVPGAAPTCSGFVFFDAVHPTTAVHALIGRAAFLQVPTPAALALFGFGLLALAARRRA